MITLQVVKTDREITLEDGTTMLIPPAMEARCSVHNVAWQIPFARSMIDDTPMLEMVKDRAVAHLRRMHKECDCEVKR